MFREVPGYRIGFRAFSPAAEPYADRRERSHPTRAIGEGHLHVWWSALFNTVTREEDS